MEIKKEIKTEGYAVKISLVEDGKTLGWVFLYIMYQDRHAEPYGYLENMFVEPEYQKHGYGTQLVRLAVAEAKQRGCYKIISTSKHHKTAVHRWYEKQGFRKMGYELRLDLIADTKVKTKDGKEEWSEFVDWD